MRHPLLTSEEERSNLCANLRWNHVRVRAAGVYLLRGVDHSTVPAEEGFTWKEASKSTRIRSRLTVTTLLPVTLTTQISNEPNGCIRARPTVGGETLFGQEWGFAYACSAFSS